MRAGAYQRRIKKKSLLLGTAAVLLGLIIFVLFGPFIWLKPRINAPLLGPRNALPALDGRLLGHLPYPEAFEEELIATSSGIQIHHETFKALEAMTKAATKNGVDLILISGYRSHALQEKIFFQVKSQRNQTAIERAKVSAPPGHSEHSTGYAIDLGDATRPETDFKVAFESTKAFDWLKRNAAKYHFVLSFPPDNAQGVSYEPWHWRFEGTADALRQFEDARRLSRRR